MKNVLVLFLSVMLLSSCGAFGPNPEFYQGMKEKKFLKNNKEAVVSSLDGNIKTYRVSRGDKFYVLATFQDDVLIKLEEREYFPQIMKEDEIEKLDKSSL